MEGKEKVSRVLVDKYTGTIYGLSSPSVYVKPLFVDVFVDWYLRQPKAIQVVVGKIFERNVYVSNSKQKISKL